MDCKFQVGQKVVCIHGRPFTSVSMGGDWDVGPATGEICKITDMQPQYGSVGLRLQGYEFNDFGIDSWFDYVCFRPLNDRPTKADISVFKKLLTPTPEQVQEIRKRDLEPAR